LGSIGGIGLIKGDASNWVACCWLLLMGGVDDELLG
jgi:hypothetical protein